MQVMVGLADVYDPPVIAYLSPPLLSHLRAAVRDTVTLHVATGLEELETLVMLHPRAILVADPQAAPGLREPRDLVPILERHPAIRGVTYTTLSPVSMRGYGLYAAHGLHHLLIRNVDDHIDRIRDLLATIPGDLMAERLLQMVEPLFRRLPISLLRAVRQLFLAPKDRQTAQALAMSGGVGRRTLDSILERSGIAPAQTLIRASRVLRFYYYTSGRHQSAKSIAPRLGYQTMHTLSSDVRLMTGLRPAALARYVNQDDFLVMLSNGLRRQDAPRQKRQRADAGSRKKPAVTVTERADLPELVRAAQTVPGFSPPVPSLNSSVA